MKSFKEKLIKQYLTPQSKKWVRVLESLSAIGYFVSSLIALYYLYTFTEPKRPLVTVLTLVSWGYLVVSLPMFFLLYKESALKKYQRVAIELLILLSVMALMSAVLLSMTHPVI